VSVTDRGTLTRIAQALVIPPHILGIAGPDDADFAAMLTFGTSVIRLADIARHSGRAADARRGPHSGVVDSGRAGVLQRSPHSRSRRAPGIIAAAAEYAAAITP
jgi:hypothetical protein